MNAGVLYLAQRLSALVLAPLVLLHLGLIVYAVQDGLSAGEILARTRGSVAWAAVYGVFVIAAAVHGSIGLRSIAAETTRMSRRALDWLMVGIGLLLAILGGRAVAAVVL